LPNYAILRKAGPARADDALRMGPELEETVEEIRREIERMRRDYRIDPAEAQATRLRRIPQHIMNDNIVVWREQFSVSLFQ
jgi:hypothetical protein